MTDKKSLEQLRNELNELEELHENHEAAELERDIDGLSESVKILERNLEIQQELKDYFKENQFELQTEMPMRMHSIHDDYIRAAVNTLGSVYMLDDQRETVEKKWASDEVINAYEQKKKKRNIEPRFTFIRKLRNIIIHQRTPKPPISFSLGKNKDGIESSLDFEKSEVISIGNLGKTSKRFLEEEVDSDRIPVTEVLRDHFIRIRPIIKWFRREVRQDNRDIIQERADIDNKIDRIRNEIIERS